jgi:hypothetical protein
MSVGRSLGICVQCFIYTRIFLFHACILMMFRVFFSVSHTSRVIHSELRRCTRTQWVVVWMGGVDTPQQNSLLPKPRGKPTLQLLYRNRFDRRLFDVVVLSCLCSDSLREDQKVTQLPGKNKEPKTITHCPKIGNLWKCIKNIPELPSLVKWLRPARQ